MSGGLFERTNEILANEIFGWNHTIKDPFEDEEISELIYDIFKLIRTFDYYKCADCTEKDYLEEKDKFKNKWLEKPKKE